MLKIDLHTQRLKSDSTIQILNAFAQDLPLPNDENLYSSGLHPWHIGLVNPEKCLQALDQAAGHENLVAIGECGLDRSIVTDFATQEVYFRQQIEIAEKHSKPLIIHCVRAYPELIRLKKEYHSPLPWIIHGYMGNHPTTLQLTRHNFYFSVGESLLTNQQKKEIVELIPLDHLFLETDDRDISISSIYSWTAQLLKVDEETLSAIILENFNRLFENKNNVRNYMNIL